MTLADLSSIGSLISSVAVLVSLAYLSLQMRQTERNQRAMMNQNAMDRAAAAVEWNAQADISGLRARVIAGERIFSAQELFQLGLILRRTLLGLQDLYVQRKVGLVDEITLENTLSISKTTLAQPVFRVVWRTRRNSYATEFAAYIDRLIEATPLVGPVDEVPRFAADLAELEGATKPG